MFSKRKLLISTKHGKEKILAPLLEKELGVTCVVPDDFDTDVLGTFTGEIERKDDPLTTLRNKCRMAMEKYGYDLSVGSEGSFGAHPFIYFARADDELLMLMDHKNQLEIVVREISTETNFNGREVYSEEQLRDFAKQALFPSHSLILRNKKDSHDKIIKGITDWETLIAAYHQMDQAFSSAYIETDMRAMHNPTRMKVIAKAAEKLIAKIKSSCPQCKSPGFGITEARPGLPCSLCGSKTRSTLSHLYVCQKCKYMKEVMYPNHQLHEDPMYCDVCNP